MLNLTTLWANSVDDKLVIVFLFFPENRIWHLMQIVSNCKLSPLETIFKKFQILLSGKITKIYFNMLSAENFTQHANFEDFSKLRYWFTQKCLETCTFITRRPQKFSSLKSFNLQSTLIILTLLILNNRLSQSENLVPVLIWKSKNR